MDPRELIGRHAYIVLIHNQNILQVLGRGQGADIRVGNICA